MRTLLRSAQRAILAGVRILFSRVLPLGCADPTTNPLWQLAVKVCVCGGMHEWKVLLLVVAATHHALLLHYPPPLPPWCCSWAPSACAMRAAAAAAA